MNKENGTHWFHSGGTLRAEDDPSAYRFGYDEPGRERSRKPAPAGDGYFRRMAFSPVKSSHRLTMTSTYFGSNSIV